MEQQNNLPEGALSALLSNPELLGRIGGILGNLTQAPDGQKAASDAKNTESPVGLTLPSAEGLGAVLSDPAMMEKLPSVIAAIAPLMQANQANAPRTPPTHEKPSSALCRDQLLLALKPFLSHERQEAVDRILRLAKLGAAFEQLQHK